MESWYFVWANNPLPRRKSFCQKQFQKKVHLNNYLNEGKWVWVINITHKKDFFLGSGRELIFHFLDLRTILGLFINLHLETKLRKISETRRKFRYIILNWKKRESIELTCQLDFKERKFEVLYQGTVIVENKSLNPSREIRPFVPLCKGDTASIKLSSYEI